MEKENEKKELESLAIRLRAKRNLIKYSEFIGGYLEKERATSFEVVLLSVELIIDACNDILIIPRDSLREMLLKIIDIHTKKQG